MWKTTDPINTLLQPEVQHRLHFVHHGRVSIIQIRLTCLAWIREKVLMAIHRMEIPGTDDGTYYKIPGSTV
jgi:hypothetical protein